MAHLTPYLFFNGQCKEAMEWYKSILGGELVVNFVKDAPVASSMPAEKQEQVIHAALTVRDDFEVFASDWMMGGASAPGTTVSLCFVCENSAEVKDLYDKFLQQGSVIQPLTEEFFGTFGSVTDKYGVNWMFQYSNEQ